MMVRASIHRMTAKRGLINPFRHVSGAGRDYTPLCTVRAEGPPLLIGPDFNEVGHLIPSSGVGWL